MSKHSIGSRLLSL